MDGIVDWLQGFIQGDGLQAIIVAIVILAATSIISVAAVRVIRHFMQVDGLPLPSSSIIVNVVRIAIWMLGISIMLSACFNVDVNALLAALGIGGIALSLGLQDTIKNFIGGIQVTIMGIVHPDDHVIIAGVEGIVQDVNWRHTTVRDYDNNTHIIPNALVSSASVQKIEPSLLVVTPVSFTNDNRNIDVLVREMEQVAKHAVEKVAPLEKDPWILLTQIGEYGTWGKLRFVLKEPTHAREARDAALCAIAPYLRNNAPDVLHNEGTDD